MTRIDFWLSNWIQFILDQDLFLFSFTTHIYSAYSQKSISQFYSRFLVNEEAWKR